jgi:uncharacterized membrane protein YhfC
MNLSPIILIGTSIVAIAIGVIVLARRRGCPWRNLGFGALAWVVTVPFLKQWVAALAEPVVYGALYVPDALFAPGSLLFYIYVGALTGLTEVLLIWPLLRYTRLGRVPWAKALAFGVGFGAFEALYLGYGYLSSIVTVLANPQAVSEAGLANLKLMSNPLFGLAPIADRIGALLVHIFCSVLLFYGVASGQARWLWLSFVYKSLVDAIVGFAYFWGTGTLAKLWTIEGLILALGCVAWWGVVQIQRRYVLILIPDPAVQTPAASNLTRKWNQPAAKGGGY